jgi:hypothetical protein
MNKIFMILILVGIVLLSGCVVEEKGPKKYTYEKDNGSYIILYPDGEFVAFDSSGTSASGTYRTVDGDLIFTYRPFGNAIKARQDGDSIIDNKGERWIKTN